MWGIDSYSFRQPAVLFQAVPFSSTDSQIWMTLMWSFRLSRPAPTAETFFPGARGLGPERGPARQPAACRTTESERSNFAPPLPPSLPLEQAKDSPTANTIHPRMRPPGNEPGWMLEPGLPRPQFLERRAGPRTGGSAETARLTGSRPSDYRSG